MFPKIKFKLDDYSKKPKEKTYCYSCGIRVNTFKNKGTEYISGFLCDSCASYKSKRILEGRKEEDNKEEN